MHCLELRLVYVLLGLLFGGQGTSASTVISGDDVFTIQHEVTGKCLIIQNDSLRLGNCSAETARSWKWGSEHRLFHTGVSACLGLEVVSKTLQLSSCSSGSISEWRCNEGLIYTIYQMRLSANADGTVALKRNTSDSWRRGGTSENICEQPYKTMHTSGGNANGVPCRFPFLYNNTWYHSCLSSDDTHPLDWCSTTDNYDLDGKWGTCLKYEEGCGTLWDISVNGRCYQVVSTAMVTWHEARDSCLSQGGDLLSISSPEERQNFEGRSDLPEQLWIGLNQLDELVGWQWSDGSPLTYVPWDSARKSECGVMKPNLRFNSESCERKLPYICEKKNSTQTQSSVELVYKATLCDDGWIPNQGYCFKFYGAQNESRQSYNNAQQVCTKDGAQLASFHSLEDVEMLNAYQLPGKMLIGWIGLKAKSNMDPYKWEDGTDVTFTYWAPSQPPLQPINTTRCVIFADVHHMWFSVPCDSQRSFLCKKPGVFNDSAAADGCPKDREWKRYRNSCYRVDTREVSYKESCKLIVNSKLEQTFINSLLKDHIRSKPLYFWTALQDTKSTGEYKWLNITGQERVAFVNWKWGEPARVGGCAVMGTNPLGRWVVKVCNEFKAGSICKEPVITETSTPVPEEPDLNATCFPGWVSRKGMKYCYKIFHEERLTRKRSWAEAQRFCEGLGAHLPSFTEQNEMSAFHDIIRDSISDDRDFWIGLNRRNPNNDNRWEWSDGQPVSMMIFPPELHEDDEYNRDCMAFKSKKQRYMMFYIFLMAQVPQRPFFPRAFHCDAKLEWVCQIARGQTPQNPEWYNPDGHHNTSLFVDGQEFWFVSDPKLSYEEAEMYCNSNQSKLATPRSITAVKRLRDYLIKNSEEHWWVDVQEPGSLPFQHPRWHYYNLLLGRCTSLSLKSIIPDYKTSCVIRQPFVCETLNVTSAENGTEEHPPGQPCDKTSSAFRNKCYTVISPKYMSFNAANEYCQTLTGSLVSIEDQAEQDFITTLLVGKPQKIWIGLSLKFHDIQWVDHTPVKFLNFNPLLHGQLRPMQINMFDKDELKLCAYMFNNDHSDMLGTWDYMPCTDLQNLAICQRYADKPAASEVTEGEFQVNDHKFKLILKENLTWYDALELCKRNQMDLASVANAYEQAVLSVNVTKAGFPLWIGLYSEDDEHYHWTDRSHTLFSRWGQEAIAGKCVYLNTDGYWKATECEQPLQGAFCHIPQVQSEVKKENTTRCPHKSNGYNWIPFKNSCYTFLLSSVRWQELDRSNGKQTCQLLVGKGEPVTIRNEEENVFIRNQLEPFQDLAKFVWLGMYRSSKNDQQLKWYDDTNVQFSKWRNGRPNITKPFMAGLSLNGDWYLTEETELFAAFKQRAIVMCKIEMGSKEEYNKDPVDVETHRGYKYHLVTKKLNWFQAVKECALMEGHLMSIYDEKVNGNVSLMARRYGFPLWIGLSNLDSSKLHFEWSDGTAVTYKALGDASTITEPAEKCAYVDTTGNWTVVSCFDELEGAICYTDEKKSRTSVASNKTCPDGGSQGSWLQFKDHCYAFDMTFYNYSVYTMSEAKHVCENLDPSSELLTINNQEENNFISDQMAYSSFITSRVWLNLNPASSGNNTDKGAAWMEESVPFAPWVQSEARSGCAVLESTLGKWSTTDCASSRSRVICKIPASESSYAKSEGVPVALVFFIIVLICIVGVVIFVVYKRTRHHYFSSVRYQRNFDEADSTSMIAEVE